MDNPFLDLKNLDLYYSAYYPFNKYHLYLDEKRSCSTVHMPDYGGEWNEDEGSWNPASADPHRNGSCEGHAAVGTGENFHRDGKIGYRRGVTELLKKNKNRYWRKKLDSLSSSESYDKVAPSCNVAVPSSVEAIFCNCWNIIFFLSQVCFERDINWKFQYGLWRWFHYEKDDFIHFQIDSNK